MTGTVVVGIADTHIGSDSALSLPEFTLDSGQLLKANMNQEAIWACWGDFWQYVTKLRKGKRLIIIHLGDMIDGDHHNTVQSLKNVDDQRNMAQAIFKPLVDLCDGAFYTFRGTPAHGKGASQDEVDVCREIGAQVPQWRTMFDIDGVTIDCSHHGRAGGRPWTTAAANIAAEVVIQCASRKQDLPMWIWRAHNHTIDDSGEKVAGTRCLCFPSWQLKTEIGYRWFANKISDIGGFILNDGALDASRARYPIYLERKTIKI